MNENENYFGADEDFERAEKIRAIRDSAKLSAEPWDSRILANDTDSVPTDEIYDGLGYSEFQEIIPDSDIPLFDADGRPLNDGGRLASANMNREEETVRFRRPVRNEYSAEDTQIYEREPVRNYNNNTERRSPSEMNETKKRKKSLKEKFLGLFPQKGDGFLESLRKIIFLISIIAIVVCGYLIADYYIDLWNSKHVNTQVMDLYWTYPDNRNDDTTEEKTEQKFYTLLDGARKLLDINSDVVGVIRIPDTPIDNPVMKADNNWKYLDMKINGDESRAGELFMDYRNKFDHVEDNRLAEPNSDNIVIYGHNMGDLTMFGILQKYRTDESFYTNHPLIYLNSNYESYVYKIFSVFILDADDKSKTAFDCWNKLDFSDEEDFYNFVNDAKRRTYILNDVDLEYGDPILTLSTCNSLLGDRGRLIVMARRVREGEDLMEGTQNNSRNPNVLMPEFYYQIRTNEKYNWDAEFIPYGPDKAGEKK